MCAAKKWSAQQIIPLFDTISKPYFATTIVSDLIDYNDTTFRNTYIFLLPCFLRCVFQWVVRYVFDVLQPLMKYLFFSHDLTNCLNYFVRVCIGIIPHVV